MNDLEIFGGKVVLLHGSDVAREAEELLKLLRKNNIPVVSMQEVSIALRPGLPYAQVYEQICLTAKHFVVIASPALNTDEQFKFLVYTALGESIKGKRLCPVLFREMRLPPFLSGFYQCRLYTDAQGDQQRQFISEQISKLVEALR